VQAVPLVDYARGMPAPIAPLVGFMLGIAFAWAAADDLARAAGHAPARSLWLATLFGLAVFAPAAGFFLAFSPDWSYAYLIDSQRMPGAVDLGLVLIDAASVPAGFVAASRWAAARKLGPVVRLSLVPIALVIAFVAFTLPRIGVHATYAQYHGDFGTRAVSGSPLGYALLWMSAVLAGAILWTLRALRMLGQARRD
jgi:hypothetical protein